ncbi:MAG TPA: HAD hydrolase family protein [Acidimicrobiales bacterium]|nr:HAD hydrolase family protein [Acidimicrobiales bacterium]
MAQLAHQELLRAVRLVASDVDGTLTSSGTIGGATVNALESLAGAGIGVLLVTGRSAGWAAALAAYMPGVVGVLAENGAVLCQPGPDVAPFAFEGLPPPGALAAMHAAVADVLGTYPGVNAGNDNFCRLTDRTVAASPQMSPTLVASIAQRHGLRHTYSTVHHHLSWSRLDKRSGVLRALEYLGTGLDPASQVVTIGDSANDAPLFAAGTFALTVGVAEAGALPVGPQVITEAGGGAGFVELAQALLGA